MVNNRCGACIAESLPTKAAAMLSTVLVIEGEQNIKFEVTALREALCEVHTKEYMRLKAICEAQDGWY